MRVTHRRLNICQAWLMTPGIWVSIEQLQASGAYGERRSINRALRKMIQYNAVKINHHREWTFTSTGLLLCGHVPARKEDPHEQETETVPTD